MTVNFSDEADVKRTHRVAEHLAECPGLEVTKVIITLVDRCVLKVITLCVLVEGSVESIRIWSVVFSWRCWRRNDMILKAT